jgi:hypothetical protein
MIFNRQFQHQTTHRWISHRFNPMWWNRTGDEPELLQAQRFNHIQTGTQVAKMNRVKRPAENTNSGFSF